ncbi:cytochrome oxidase subunit III [Crenobacter cavernae]|uniref:Cytochrome oxidase subunit III n=2 Tax=Crenobacter cavernae TaxID=2290923 RepID=A0ABY0FG60_9NEIS|nr:cytochrome oxidase subunit III [Crenobacter cavernae]
MMETSMRTSGRGRLGRACRESTPESVALSVFIGVVGVLFSLLIVAYAMRMRTGDWRTLPVPWQLGLSTAMLILSSASLQWASVAARRGERKSLNKALLATGVFAVAFLASQLWVWQRLVEFGYLASANPANGFFYLITGLHGLHLVGGLVALGRTVAHSRLSGAVARTRASIALCARYWHFLLALWLVLYAALSFLTPAIVAFICGAS